MKIILKNFDHMIMHLQHDHLEEYFIFKFIYCI